MRVVLHIGHSTLEFLTEKLWHIGQRMNQIAGLKSCGNGQIFDALIVTDNGRMTLTRRNQLGTREGGQIDDEVWLVVSTRISHTICKNQSALGIGIIHFHRATRVHAQNVVGACCVRPYGVFR